MDNRALTVPGYRFAGDICLVFSFALELCLGIYTIVLLIRDVTTSRKRKIFFVAFITLILGFQTLAVMCWIISSEEILIEKPDTTSANEATWRNIAGPFSILMTEWLDGLLLIYRCYIIWGSNVFIIILPILLFLTVTTLGLATIIQSKTNPVFVSSVLLGIWVPTPAAFILLMTILISFRIIAAQRAIIRIGGPLTRLQINYMGIVGVFMETALPFSLLSVVISVALARDWNCTLILMAIWGTCAGIIPILIIYRIAKGTAWSNDNSWTTRSAISEIRFEMQTFSVREPVSGDLQPGFDFDSDSENDRRTSKQC